MNTPDFSLTPPTPLAISAQVGTPGLYTLTEADLPVSCSHMAGEQRPAFVIRTGILKQATPFAPAVHDATISILTAGDMDGATRPIIVKHNVPITFSPSPGTFAPIVSD